MPEHDPEGHSEAPSLEQADWLRWPETTAVFEALCGDGVETRAVGGAVRNALLGLPVTEIDLATTAVPEMVMTLAERAGLKAVPTGIDHGTVTLIVDGIPFEVTTLRRDVATYGRHADVSFTSDWEEDAKRRDFTLNALYVGRDGKVFDPIGGFADLTSGRVRFIGDAEARIKEDFLRILRFFRFNAYYGKGELDPEGLEAAVKLRGGLERLSGERVGGELKRILVAPGAAPAIEALYDHGLLVDLLGGVPHLARFARLISIEAALGLVSDAALRLAALAVWVEEDAPRLGQRFRLSNAEQAELALAALAGREAALPAEAAAKATLYRLGPDDNRAYLLLAWADCGASAEDQIWRLAFTLPDRWQPPTFPLRGTDIMALGELKGPEIGAALNRLEQDWIESDFGLDRQQLLAKARQLIAKQEQQPGPD